MTGEAQINDLKLTPPDLVPVVQPEKAAGLVPVNDEQKSALESRVEQFIADLIAEDVNSPAFGRRIDQLTHLGSREIAEAAGQSNRFLDRPVRAMDESAGVGSNLAELRRTVEDLDPSTRGNLLAPRKLFCGFWLSGIDPIASHAQALRAAGRPSVMRRQAISECPNSPRPDRAKSHKRTGWRFSNSF